MKTVCVRMLKAAVVCAAVVVAACGGSSSEPPAPPAVRTNPVDPAKAGRVTGVIRLEGTPPAAQAIRMDSDPYCVKQGQKVTQTYVTGSGGTLQNVFVYVKDGLGNLQFPVPAAAAVLDQKGCMYEPHVLGIQVGQTLEILSSDNTLHNVHAMPQQNREFNKAHQMAGLKHTHVFSTKEVMVPFKCDVHKWMNAYVGVLDHPFHAVSGANGAFELKGLPAGTYTIEAWHEALGIQTQTVTISEQETRDITFTFRAA